MKPTSCSDCREDMDTCRYYPEWIDRGYSDGRRHPVWVKYCERVDWMDAPTLFDVIGVED